MKKALLVAVPVIVVGSAMFYYPRFQAPKAHEAINTQLLAMKNKMLASDSGDLTIVSHETSTKASDIEIKWSLNVAEEYQVPTVPQTLHFVTKGSIALNALPSLSLYDSIQTTTTSEDIDTLLLAQGHTDGLTMSCETLPISKGHDTNCNVNALLFENKDLDASAISTIELASSTVQFTINEGDLNFESKAVMPSMIAKQGDTVMFEASALNTSMSSPYHPQNAPILDILTSKIVADGITTTTLNLEKLSVAPPGDPAPVVVNSIALDSKADITDGVGTSGGLLKIGTIEGLPENIKSVALSAELSEFDFQKLFVIRDKFNTALTTQPQGQDITAELIGDLAKAMSLGPKFSMGISVHQDQGETLAMDLGTQLKQQPPEEIEQALENLMAAGPSNPMALLPFVLENLTVDVQAALHQDLANTIAVANASQDASTADLPAPDVQASAQQSLAMLNVMGLIEIEGDHYKSTFTMDENGFLLNGKDLGPLLGLPPQNQP